MTYKNIPQTLGITWKITRGVLQKSFIAYIWYSLKINKVQWNQIFATYAYNFDNKCKHSVKHSLHQRRFDGAFKRPTKLHQSVTKLYQVIGILEKLCTMRDIRQKRQNFLNCLKSLGVLLQFDKSSESVLKLNKA
jgi:hypothetical protein